MNVQLSRGYSHGEPGGAGGAPTPRFFQSEPVAFNDRYPLFNDPQATPRIDPYTGNPNDPTFPEQYYSGGWDSY
jgi:hypothetical protein